MRGDIRNMKTIQLVEEVNLLVAKNNGQLQLIKIN